MFMLISGVTCLVGCGAAAYLEACRDSLAAMDWREIGSLTCAGVWTNAGSGEWFGAGLERVASEVFKLAWANGCRGSGSCRSSLVLVLMSQPGLAPVMADGARASVATLDSGHGAVQAVDGVASSFWAKLGLPARYISMQCLHTHICIHMYVHIHVYAY